MKRITFILLSALSVLFVACSMGDSGSDLDSNVDSGTGGSLASFTIVGDYLYTVDNSRLKVADISTPAQPTYKKTVELGFGIETIFPHGNNLFIGSMMGMHTFSLADPENPQHLSYYEHIFSCDPVVADQQFAYVTLNSVWGNCGRSSNQLQIVDISDLSKPTQIASFNMNSPRGLSIQNDTLYVCDQGLKVFKLSADRKTITPINQFNISATDVISLGNHLLVIGSDGFYQYQINNNNIELLSSLLID